MVLREVREERHVVDDPVDAVQLEGVARHLHDAGVDAPVAHEPEQRVQVGRLGRRAHRLDALVPDARLDRADESGALPVRPQRRLDEVGRGRLAVGAGDAEHRQGLGGVSVDLRRDVAEDAARVLRDDDGHGDVRLRSDLSEAGRVGEDGDGSGGHGVGDEARAVHVEPREGRIQVAREHGAAVERDPGHDERRTAVRGAPRRPGSGSSGRGGAHPT